ncbi:hypothetical protein DFJ63DRAFT_319142 [Scheffersomyces coipomensis]|uniref:uncharacterized protein n=1 Tax=Scheffersomyces coipomensis TaxID=1788519 RepID=UPI00315C50E4
MFNFKVIRPISIGKSMFYSNANITSLSHSFKSGLRSPPGNVNYLSSNLKILKSTNNFKVLHSSMGPNPFKEFKFISITRKTFIQSSRNASRNNSWSKYNKYYNLKNSPWDKLKLPALFTALFCIGTVVATPYLFQYTPLSYFRKRPEAFITALLAINGIVFLLWKVPGAWKYLNRYALLQKDGISSSLSMLGSAFSHQSFMHLFINMFVLQSFGTSLCATLGTSVFAVLYLNSAVISSFVSLAVPILMRSSLAVGSLGASGAIFSIFGAFSFLFPHAPVAFFFIPIPGGAWIAFLGSVAWNAAGVVMRWGSYDYAAHLGGSLAGILFAAYYKRKAQERRRTRSISY